MLNEDVFYDTKAVPLSDRESFNNTILLLTMVKSKYYYIIGFSRPEETITIGFDFESKTEGIVTKELIVDFGKSESDIILSCQVYNVSQFETNEKATDVVKSNQFYLDNGKLYYIRRISKDRVFPSSVKSMNKCLLLARQEIGTLLTS